MIGIIAAVDFDGLMGYDNQIPWHSPEDLRRFKEITLNSTVIMGRKTYESIGKPLPNRKNYILTSKKDSLSNLNYSCFIYSSLDEVLLKAQKSQENFWIIGGAEIYKASLKSNLVNIIDLTILNGRVDISDLEDSKKVYFPMIPFNYSVQSEKINANDNNLLHRRYYLRS